MVKNNQKKNKSSWTFSINKKTKLKIYGFFYNNKFARNFKPSGGVETTFNRRSPISLTNFASKITLIHRRDKLRAEKILQEKLFNKKN